MVLGVVATATTQAKANHSVVFRRRCFVISTSHGNTKLFHKCIPDHDEKSRNRTRYEKMATEEKAQNPASKPETENRGESVTAFDKILGSVCLFVFSIFLVIFQDAALQRRSMFWRYKNHKNPKFIIWKVLALGQYAIFLVAELFGGKGRLSPVTLFQTLCYTKWPNYWA